MELMWWWMWPAVIAAVAVTVAIGLFLRRREKICLLYTSDAADD